MRQRLLGVFCACIAAWSVAACASMEVNVDVVDADEVRAYVAASASRRQAFTYLAQSEADVRGEVADVRAALNEAYAGLRGVYQTAHDGTRNAAARTTLQAAISDIGLFRDEAMADSGTYLTQAVLLNHQLREAYLRADRSEQFYSAGTFSTVLQQRIAAQQMLTDSVSDLIDGMEESLDANASLIAAAEPALAGAPAAEAGEGEADNATQEALAEARQQLEDLRSTVRSIIGDGSLVGSGYAYAVRSVPAEHWQDNFNQAYGGGFMGNTDIVIRLNSQGDFSVKGLTFDPSTVASVASRVSTQAVLLGAQIAGVPAQSSGSGSHHLAQANSALADAEETRLTREAMSAGRRRALLEMGMAILSEEDAISASGAGADESRDRADASIRAQFDAWENLMKLDGYPADAGGSD
ncbi:hypothetical protein [Maricaulis parjimensis]|uniref:hypothetical protein n=1 Tax=Maricaulis parjimensis TaxID=144023 RepID=UPI00193ACF6E|nr:hypothetical protein [Maricaulis parjimensis]